MVCVARGVEAIDRQQHTKRVLIMDQCPVCGGAVSSSIVEDRFEVIGVGEGTAVFPVYSCESCEMSFRDYESEKARDAAVRLAYSSRQRCRSQGVGE